MRVIDDKQEIFRFRGLKKKRGSAIINVLALKQTEC